ncbi:hypothetical protein IWQ60_005996 [Tieghemiomyces parasiticus]|uniref:Increased recombination centers protein 6 n=1 Tax=Tieghemiomyces parasiticus TaxID=78921 RepID=A0A9W8AAR2_9FUNG|nr:hypothetical protein IWQ60_005996 [Tieghemiomyces parasiticus]
MRDKILVLGQAGVGKRRLVDQVMASDVPINEGAVRLWTIDTKYFTAPVTFWLDTLPDKVEPGTVEAFDQVAEAVAALVFVFNPAHPVTFTRVEPWAAFCERHDIAVRLCVAMPATPTEDTFGDFQDHHQPTTVAPDVPPPVSTDPYEDWCIAHGFEFVDAALTPLERDNPGDSKEGISRVREALETHTWESLQRKAPGTGGPTQPAPVHPDADVAGAFEAFLHGPGDLDEMVQALRQVRTHAQGLDDGSRQDLAALVAHAFLSRAGAEDDVDELGVSGRHAPARFE